MDKLRLIQLPMLLGIISILMIAPVSAQYAVPLNLEVGDTFQYRVEELTSMFATNGTNKPLETPFDAPYDFDVEVTNIQNVSYSPGIQTSPVMVNYTMDDGDQVTEMYSFVDAWRDLTVLFVGIGLLAEFPSPGMFNSSVLSLGDGFSLSDINLTDLPLFATSDPSAYSSYLIPYPGVITTIEAGETQKTKFYGVIRDNIFHQEVLLGFENSTTNGDGISSSYDILLEAKIEVDLSSSIVQLLDISIGFDVTYGQASSSLGLSVYAGTPDALAADQGQDTPDNTSTEEDSGSTWLVASFGIVLISTAVVRKRKY